MALFSTAASITMALLKPIFTRPKTQLSNYPSSLFSPSSIYNQNQPHNNKFMRVYYKFHKGVRNYYKAISCIDEGDYFKGTTVINSPNVVALEYADLNLPHHIEEVGHVRIRQHVNPLTAAYSVPVEAPDWNSVFRDASLPLMVDVGCGSGRFILWLAKRNVGSNNYLGLEIRRKLVNRANFWVKELGLYNVHFIFANATVSFQQLLSSYPGPLVLVSVLCPDPHFKKRHHKRRVLQKPLVDSIVNNLTSGGQIFMQSDVLDVAIDMRNQFDSVSDVLHIDAINPRLPCDPDGWLLSNPMGIRTEREIHAELEGNKIYRRLYQKRK